MLDGLALVGAVVLVPMALGMVAWVAPVAQPEIGGVAQKIFYAHVPSAITAFLAFGTALVAGVAYLRTRAERWDALGVASIEVGMLFCTLVVCTGPIWAKPVWGVYWNPEPRLLSFAVMWFTYAGYLILRGAMDAGARRAAVGAAYAVVASINVPIVYLAVRLVPPGSQLHPVKADLAAPWMRPTLYAMFAAFGALMVTLISVRARLERARLALACQARL